MRCLWDCLATGFNKCGIKTPLTTVGSRRSCEVCLGFPLHRLRRARSRLGAVRSGRAARPLPATVRRSGGRLSRRTHGGPAGCGERRGASRCCGDGGRAACQPRGIAPGWERGGLCGESLLGARGCPRPRGAPAAPPGLAHRLQALAATRTVCFLFIFWFNLC